MVTSWIVSFLLFCLQEVVWGLGEDVCYHERRDETVTCQFGCCGSKKEKECCDPMSMIIGISIGGVILVAAIITAVVCCIKHHTKKNRRCTPRPRPIPMVTMPKGPPAYPGETYHVYNDPYQRPVLAPPPTYEGPPKYVAPTHAHVPDDQRVYFSNQSGNQPPPPYGTN